MKRFFLTAAIVMSTATLSFGEDVVYADEFHAMPIVHPSGWSKGVDATDPAVSSVTVTGEAGASAAISLVRGARAEGATDSDIWTEATLLGTMFENEGENSLAKFKMMVVGYKVTATNLDPAEAYLSFGISKDYSASIEDAGYAKFHAQSAKGISDVAGTETVYDTLMIEDFVISYGSTLYPEGTKLSDEIAASYLAGCNGFAFSIESETWDAEQNISLNVTEVKFLGDAGLRTDMGLAASSIQGFDVSNGTVSNIVAGITNNSVNLSVPTSGNYDVSIFSANGRMIHSTSANFVAGTAGSVSLQEQSAGVYFVQVVGQNINVTEKVTLK